MTSLSELNTRLRRIFRGQEQYGDGPPAEQARRFRLEQLLQPTVEQAQRNSADVPREPIDLLVSLSGFSPETTILAFELLRPQRLMIIASEEARASVDIIQQALNLPLSRLDVRYTDPIDPRGIYQFIKEAARPFPEAEEVKAVIDITGGKKVMSASAALAAAQLDLALCYINSTFDAEMRLSVPGTERLVIVPNPTALFGDREMDAALVAFRHGAYAAAQARFAEIAETAYEPSRARFLRDLASVYESWCDLNLEALQSRAQVMRDRLSDPAYRVPPTVARRLRAQLVFLDTLTGAPRGERENPSFLLNFYLLGEHYLRLGRYDFAALLHYRTIESCFAQRLARLAPGFRTAAPDYRLFGKDREELQARYRAATGAVHEMEATALPALVGLMDAALLLFVLDDPMLKKLDLTTDKALRHFKGRLLARNKSVLAHGTETIDEALSGDLGRLATRSVRAFWALEFDGENIDERIATLEFVVDP
jgi:CRISPR-associated protein (TIGR02710 family)